MTDPALPTEDPTEALRQQLAQANQRLIQAELKAHATQLGIHDLDGLKLLDQSTLKLDEHGAVPNAAELLAKLKTDKPWLFKQPSNNTSHPAPPPAAEPPKTRSAKDMSYSEWQKARDRLIRGG